MKFEWQSNPAKQKEHRMGFPCTSSSHPVHIQFTSIHIQFTSSSHPAKLLGGCFPRRQNYDAMHIPSPTEHTSVWDHNTFKTAAAPCNNTQNINDRTKKISCPTFRANTLRIMKRSQQIRKLLAVAAEAAKQKLYKRIRSSCVLGSNLSLNFLGARMHLIASYRHHLLFASYRHHKGATTMQ